MLADELPTGLEQQNGAVTPAEHVRRQTNNLLGTVINKLTDHPGLSLPGGGALYLETQSNTFTLAIEGMTT